MLYVDLTLLYNGGKPSTVKDKYIKGESENFFFVVYGNISIKSLPNSKRKVSFEKKISSKGGSRRGEVIREKNKSVYA